MPSIGTRTLPGLHEVPTSRVLPACEPLSRRSGWTPWWCSQRLDSSVVDTGLERGSVGSTFRWPGHGEFCSLNE